MALKYSNPKCSVMMRTFPAAFVSVSTHLEAHPHTRCGREDTHNFPAEPVSGTARANADLQTDATMKACRLLVIAGQLFRRCVTEGISIWSTLTLVRAATSSMWSSSLSPVSSCSSTESLECRRFILWPQSTRDREHCNGRSCTELLGRASFHRGALWSRCVEVFGAVVLCCMHEIGCHWTFTAQMREARPLERSQ